MPSPKQTRARTIVSDFLERDRLNPIRDPRSPLPARMVGEVTGLWARVTLDHRFDVAPAYGTRTERRPIEDKGWIAVTIYNRNLEVLAVNVRDTYCHIGFYKPGAWEQPFGVDWEGDYQLHAWGDAPIGDHLEEQHALRAKDLELAPVRGRPREVDELRSNVMRPRRQRSPEARSNSPLTVSLERR